MAIDLVARPSDGCLSVVCDAPAPAIEAISMSGNSIRALLGDGAVMEIGELTDSMRLDAGRCNICIVIEMNGDSVIGSRRVNFR
jgi:hypothetical protein